MDLNTIQAIIYNVTAMIVISGYISIFFCNGILLYYNGNFLKKNNVIRQDIRYVLLNSLLSSLFAIIPSWVWMSEQSYTENSIGFTLGMLWNIHHLYNLKKDYYSNKIACAVGIKNCNEIEKELLDLKYRLNEILLTRKNNNNCVNL